MSRIGKMPVKIQSGVKIDLKGDLLKVEGPKGKLQYTVPRGVVLNVGKEEIVVAPSEPPLPNSGALHGLARTLVYNMVQGVAVGFTKELDIVGVGYRASMKGQVLSMTLGYSHPVDYTLPTGITGKVEGNTHIVVSGADKILLGMVAAKIRGFKEPEPYQGKGVRYTNEHIVRKQGKAAGAK